jgi:glutaredoxin 2
MALGYLNIPFESKVLRYDDEATPTKLTGVKMLPILQFEGGAMNESLDIIKFLDKENKLKLIDKDIGPLLNKLGDPIHSLAMPYWIYTPEFDQISRDYFKNKKEMKRGPFKDLVLRKDEFIQELMPLLKKVEDDLYPFYQSSSFGLNDILLAAHLWGLYIVPEFQFSEKLHTYLQSVKNICHFNYHQDFWS